MAPEPAKEAAKIMKRRKGIWCPRHPEQQLVRITFPNGKIDLRCPACTSERVAKIGLALPPSERGSHE